MSGVRSADVYIGNSRSYSSLGCAASTGPATTAPWPPKDFDYWALPLFADASLDFIYVDGYAHDGELNGQTFRDWFPKLKQGGIIAGDDYHADWPLVMQAVDKFVADNRLELHVIHCSEDSWNSKYPTWFAMKP